MKISHENYEAYYLDYLEGTLSKQEIELFITFIQENPDLKLDDNLLPTFHSDEQITLPTDFHAKIKAIPSLETEFSELAIGEIEGILTPTEHTKFENLLQENERFENEYNLYKQTKLIADKNILFPAKSKLKKGQIISIKPLISFLVAASVLAFVYFNFTPKNLDSKHKIATLNSTKTSKKRSENAPIISELGNKKSDYNKINKTINKSLERKPIISIIETSSDKSIAFTEVSIPIASSKDSIIQTQITEILLAKTEKLPNSVFNKLERQNNEYESIVSNTLDKFNALKEKFGLKLSKEQKEDMLAESINLHTRISDANYNAVQKLEKYKQQIISQFNLLFATKAN